MKLPRELAAQLKSDIADAEANLVSAIAAFEAVCKYPPLRIA